MAKTVVQDMKWALGGIIPKKKSLVVSTSYNLKILYVCASIVKDVKNQESHDG